MLFFDILIIITLTCYFRCHRAGSQLKIKISNVFDNSWEPKVNILYAVILCVDPWDMLNKFCFHVYAQKSLFIAENDNVFSWHHNPAPAKNIEQIQE